MKNKIDIKYSYMHILLIILMNKSINNNYLCLPIRLLKKGIGVH